MTQPGGDQSSESAERAKRFADLARRFEDRGKRWAERMLERLKTHYLEIPLVWPGTREQAETLVHAFADDAWSLSDRERLVEIVQNGARRAWRDLVGSP